MPVRLFKIGSLVLAVAGLALLLFAANHTEVPTTKIGSLRGTMNWAYVQLEGVVSRQPVYDPTTRYLSIWLSDGTGEALVSAYRSNAETLLAENRVPVMGDRVKVQGTLRIREEFPVVTLEAPHRLEAEPGKPTEIAIGRIDSELLYQKVTVQGMVRTSWVPYEGLRILRLRDGTGEIDVTFSSHDAAPVGLPAVVVGQSVEVTGAVDLYRNAPQISLGRGSDLTVLEDPIAIAPTRRIGELSAKDIGSLATVQATIMGIHTLSSGVKFDLDDASGRIALVIWQELYERLVARSSLARGARISVLGRVAEYRGELEIVPEVPADVTVVGQVDLLSEELGNGQITIAEVDPTAQAVGQIADRSEVSQPTSYTSPAPAPTNTVQTSPTSTPTATAAAIPTATPAVQVREVSQITPEDRGSVFSIAQAAIVDIDFRSAGVWYRITDSSESIGLWIYQDVYERINAQQRYDLIPGTVIGVTGTIGDYGGDLEIVPQTESDLRVVSSADHLPMERRSIAEISVPADSGRIFSIEGSAARLQKPSYLKFYVQDNTGEFLVFVPEVAAQFVRDLADLVEGAWVKVTGEVSFYERGQEWQIMVHAGADVTVEQE